MRHKTSLFQIHDSERCRDTHQRSTKLSTDITTTALHRIPTRTTVTPSILIPLPSPHPPHRYPRNNSRIMSPLKAAIRLPNHQCCHISLVPLYHRQVHLPKARTLHLVLTGQPRRLNTVSQCMISPRITTVVAANPSGTMSVITMTRSKMPLVMRVKYPFCATRRRSRR